MVRPAGGAGGVRSRRMGARAHTDRRGARHHQQPGADQHLCAGALAGRNRKTGHLPHRDRARRHARPRIFPLAVAQRLLAGDRGVRREDQHLFRPPADQRAPARNSQQSSARRRAEDRAGLHRARRDLHVDRRVRAAPREQGAGRTARLAERRRLSHPGRTAPGERARARRLSAHGAGLDHPAAAQERAGRGGGGCDRRIRQAVPRPARPREADRAGAVLRRHRSRDRGQQPQPGSHHYRAERRRLRRPRHRPGRDHRRHRRNSRGHARKRADPRQGHRGGQARRPDPHRQRQRAGRGGGRGNGADADRRQQPHRGRRGRRQGRSNPRHAAARHRAQDRAQSYPARRRHHRHRRDQSVGRRAAGDRRAVSALGKFPRRGHHRRGHPDRDADDGGRHVAGADQRQSHEPRRPRFRAPRRRRRHHHREQPAPPRGAPAWRGTAAHLVRAAGNGARGRRRDDPAHRLRTGDHHPGLRPAAHLQRGRRQDVRADGADRDHGARGGFRSVHHVGARADRDRGDWPGAGKRERGHPRPETAVRAAAGPRGGIALSGDRRRRRAVRRGAPSLQPPGSGVHPLARREKYLHARAAHPQHGAEPVAGDAVCGGEDRQRLSAGGLRLLEDRHGRDRRRSDAAQRVGHVHHPEAARAVAGPEPAQGRAGGGNRARREGAAGQCL